MWGPDGRGWTLSTTGAWCESEPLLATKGRGRVGPHRPPRRLPLETAAIASAGRSRRGPRALASAGRSFRGPRALASLASSSLLRGPRAQARSVGWRRRSGRRRGGACVASRIEVANSASWCCRGTYVPTLQRPRCTHRRPLRRPTPTYRDARRTSHTPRTARSAAAARPQASAPAEPRRPRGAVRHARQGPYRRTRVPQFLRSGRGISRRCRGTAAPAPRARRLERTRGIATISRNGGACAAHTSP